MAFLNATTSNLNLGGNAYLAPFTLIGALIVVHIDGTQLKNDTCRMYAFI